MILSRGRGHLEGGADKLTLSQTVGDVVDRKVGHRDGVTDGEASAAGREQVVQVLTIFKDLEILSVTRFL